MSRTRPRPYSMFRFGQLIERIELEDYLNEFETFIKNKVTEIEKRYDEIYDKKTEDYNEQQYLEYYKDNLIDENIKFGQTFTNHFRATFLSLLITFIENELKIICDFHKSKNNICFGISELRGNSDFEKAEVYLKNTENIFLKSFETWRKINDYKFVRNKFAHQKGEIPISNGSEISKIENICKFYAGISVKKKHKKLIITLESKEFCQEALNVVFEFIEELITALDKKKSN